MDNSHKLMRHCRFVVTTHDVGENQKQEKDSNTQGSRKKDIAFFSHGLECGKAEAYFAALAKRVPGAAPGVRGALSGGDYLTVFVLQVPGS